MKNEAEVSNICSISGREIPWSVSPKKPSVSAAWINCAVISSNRVSKSWREILGMLRAEYFVGAIAIEFGRRWL